MIRNFIEINEEKCNGCGNCVVACAEGALKIIDGKAKVVNDSFCDGLGACIGHCPTDALKIVKKEVTEFDEKLVQENLQKQAQKTNQYNVPCNCPGMEIQDNRDKNNDVSIESISQLKQWPIQLHLVSHTAPYFKECNLLIAASCTAFSFGNFHQEFLRNHTLVIACPKLDQTEGYLEKLTEIINKNSILSITVARMEVPCCKGLTMLAEEAIKSSTKKVPFLEQVISLKGKIL
ncbi:MAG: 4Fe-4S binding protein [Candidatus Margulisiibacteriota bacterium]|jgi:NAD-dependent dihydropyrimidine dehydrogenase PreA subunit